MSRDERLLIRSVITTCGDVTTSPFYSRPRLGFPMEPGPVDPGALSLATTPYVRTRASLTYVSGLLCQGCCRVDRS
jgi:hypothetical protein